MITIVLAVTSLCAPIQDEIHRVHLRNGNYLDGTVLTDTEKGIILQVANGEIFIPRDYIDLEKYVQKIRTRPKIQMPAKVDTPRPTDGKEPIKTENKVNNPTGNQPKDTVTPKETVKKVDAALRELEDSSDLEKPKAAEKLARIGEEGALYLAQNLEKISTDLLPWITNVFVKINTPAVGEELIKKLQGTNVRVKYVAVQALASMKQKGAATQIRSVLKEKDPSLKILAINALLTLESKDSAGELVSLMKDKDESVRKTAGFALVKFSNDFGQQAEVSGRLLEMIDTAGDKEAAEVAFVLGEIKAQNAVQKLVRLFDSDSESARAQAFIAVGKIRDKNAIGAISAKAAVEKSQWVKIQIAWALEQIKDDSCIPVLINMLSDEDDQVKSAALRSLVHITNQAKLGEDPKEWIKWWDQRKKGGSTR